MTIARIFGFQWVLSALLCHTGDFADELCIYLSKIENDKNLIIKWVERFIEDIENKEIKDLADEYWQSKLQVVNDKKDFAVRDLFLGKW